jgi:Phage P22-like portal protein
MASRKKKSSPPKANDENLDFVRKAVSRYERAFDKERQNITQALEDLEFRIGEQWPSHVRREREVDHRPCLTVNKIPTYVRQITGDIRLMRPSIKVVPVDSRGDPDTAEVLGGLIRYIENRSDAQHAYVTGADSQVAAGIGHWRVLTEYAGDTTFDQEIRISTVADGVGVVWDPDSILPNKEDARCCFVPVDLSHDEFKERYPDAPIEDFSLTLEGRAALLDGWFADDFVRVCEYWERRPETRTLAMLPNGAIDDITEQPERLAQLKKQGARIEERESHCVYRSVISSCHLLEPAKKWPGRYIPIVPVFGEEVQVGRRTVRHGIIRYLKEPQQAYNYFRSAETEAIALQPKAPWLVTDKNIEDNEDMWLTANTRNFPYLLYKPDQKNGMAVPQRINARMDTSGMVEGLQISRDEMKEVTGIYDAALGQKSNETSGKAIMARQQESDVGSYVYVENFSRAIKHTGRILLDLIPHIYDAARTIRIVGEDGKVDIVNINQQLAIDMILNDVTVAAYDVVLDQGPSYATKREEAREGMLTFLQQAPSAAPVVLDLIANAQDWPNADKFSKRLKTLLPPNIQQMEAEESGEAPPPVQPSPEQMEMQFEQQKLQVEQQKVQVDQYKVNADLTKAEMSLAEKQMELRARGIEAFGPNDVQTLFGQAVVTLSGLATALGAVVEQLNAPKRIVRDPVSGRAVGVETVTKH